VNVVQVKVNGMAFDNQTKQNIVILRELEGERQDTGQCARAPR
jgi:hypothetical protein